MAEGPQWKAYEYRTNSSVVLQSARRHKSSSEATGEPESLVGRINHPMGDLYKPPTRVDRKALEKAEAKKKRLAANDVSSVHKRVSKLSKPAATSVLENDILENIRYQPRLRETRLAYEQLLHFVERRLGDQQPDIVMNAADEILALLKDQNLQPSGRQKEVEFFLGPLSTEQYTELNRICGQITDYVDAMRVLPQADDDAEVAVLISNEEEDEAEEEDEESEEEMEEDHHAMLMDDQNQEDEETMKIKEDSDVMKTTGGQLDPRNIDAYWLQRSVNKFIKDAEQSAKLSVQILASLGKADDREVENELLELLDYDRFDFIKMVLNNRTSIYYATRLRQAQTDEEREGIEQEMKQDSAAYQVLKSLQAEGTTQSADFRNKLQSQNIFKDKPSASEESDFGSGIYAFENRAATQLDLDDLAFQQGGHLMTNKKCVLPQGTRRISSKEYEEVTVPGIKSVPDPEDVEIPISDFPEWAQKAFQGIRSLNLIQSKLKKIAFETNENILLCAPTGAGKTNVALMAMLNLIGRHIDLETGEVDLSAFKILYIAPMKSLVQEMVYSFANRLAPYNIEVRELSGDSTLTKAQINSTQLIVTTPEKWDIVTRKAGDRMFTELVKLIIIDEIHLLHDDRGPVLESIVARTIRQVEFSQELIRLVGLSATLPNYQDVATFLRVKEGLFAFKNQHRPIPLEQHFVGITVKKPFRRFQLMKELCYEKMLGLAGEQILIFVHSRKETASTAKALRDMLIEKGTLTNIVRCFDASTKEILKESVEQTKNMDLKELLLYGFAIHHAGMLKVDRVLVEDLFSDRRIQVLVSTATLAWGVNLPAHAVIIKGTQVYSSELGDWTELSQLDVMQMLGRAGRPQYDTRGVGIVLTLHHELQYYLSLLNQQLPIESQFIKRLADNLNAEIVLGTIQTVKHAVDWLGYTYFYICMLRNPTLYGISVEDAEKDKYLEQRRYDLIHSAASILSKNNLIKYDRKSGRLQETELGRIASYYYIPYQSIAIYNEHMKITTGDVELLRIFSLSHEFSRIIVRAGERLELEKLVERVPIPVKEGVDEPAAKINVLLQAYISRLKLDGYLLMSDMVYITQSASRIMRALFEIALKRGWAQVAEKCLSYCKMIDKRMWVTQSPLRQFKCAPEVIRKLEKKEFGLDRLITLSAQEIGELLRYPALGKMVYQYVHQIPKLDISPTVQPITRSLLQVELVIIPDFEFVERHHGLAQCFWIFVVDVNGETILHCEPFTLKKSNADKECFVAFTVPMYEPTPPQYFIRIFSDRWIGNETIKPISFRHLILPNFFPETRSLLDLQPLSISALKNPVYEAIYAPHFNIFNHIQTQVFNALYNTDGNVLLCCPTGSGKTACAELAILREWNKEMPGNIVYLTHAEQIQSVVEDWRKKFPGKQINELTDNAAVDMKLLDRSDIAVSSVRTWDILSRRWKQRPAIQRTSLFIIDELQLLGDPDIGSTLEVVVSRMRYMSKQLKFQQKQQEAVAMQSGLNKPTVGAAELRFVGLASCIANANNICEWLGVQSSNMYNFHPLARPIPLEVTLQGFENYDYSSRMASMCKPLIHAISRLPGDAPILIYVPSRKASKIITHDLKAFVLVEEAPDRFLKKAAPVEMKRLADELGSAVLAQTLPFGIGIYNESMTEREKKLVKHCFDNGMTQVMIATRNVAWSLNSRARFLAIMGTQYYDGKERRYTEYKTTDILQMIGQAGRQGIDSNAYCLVMCHAPRREFYKKFIFEPLPVESKLDRSLHDHMNVEIYNKVIENKQEAMDYLTWTFYYRRLVQNPNYYGLQGITHSHLSDHLSELIEETLNDLEEAKCNAIEDNDLSILNAGMISAFYYIHYTTIELFNSSLSERTKMRGLIDIVTNASEFEDLPLRHKEDRIILLLSHHLPMKIEKPDYFSIATKVNVLLQCHFSRRELNVDLTQDQKFVLVKLPELFQAMVDTISSSGWLLPAIAAMELAQMVVQAMWESDHLFRQLPHFTQDVIERVQQMEPECETIFDLVELSDERRNEILQFTPAQMADVAVVCNQYPNINMQYEMSTNCTHPGDSISLSILLERELDEGQTTVKPVHAPYFPKIKIENWWLVLGDLTKNTLMAIKRLPLSQSTQQVNLKFTAPEDVGDYELTLYLISDSWIGCDQEYKLDLRIVEASEDKTDSSQKMEVD